MRERTCRLAGSGSGRKATRTYTHEWEWERAHRGKSVQGAAAAVVVIRVAGIEEIQAQEAGRDHFASVSREGGKAKVLLCFLLV